MFKSKKILVMSALSIAVALSACQPKQTEKKEEQPKTQTEKVQEKLVGETQELSLNIQNCQSNQCSDLSIDRLKSNQPFVDKVIDEQILKLLKETFELTPEQENTDNAASEPSSEVEPTKPLTEKDKLEKQVVPYVKAFLNLEAEIKALNANHQINVMIKPKILNSREPLATVVLNSSSYLGGAHGSSAQEYFNFDLDEKKQIKLNDLVEANKLKDLEKVAYEQFKIWVVESELTTNVDEYEQTWKFKLTDNFNLGKNGLILQYAEYEIAPYFVGLPRITIPYEQLQTILKPKYLPESLKQVNQPASEIVVKEKK